MSHIEMEGIGMSNECCGGLRVGQPVPNFTMETFEPTKGDFSTLKPSAKLVGKSHEAMK